MRKKSRKKKKIKYKVVTKIAKRRYYPKRYYAKRVYRRAKSGIGGLSGMIWPVGAGIADSYLDGMLPVQGVGATMIGMFGHNSVIKNIGLYKIGSSIGNILPLPGISSGNQGGLL